jgi:riboflavin kinase / FMN adenylyltransferase
MIHVRTINDVHLNNSWVTIGSFDGVHLGHQSIIHPLVAEAHKNAASAVVITFHPHPAVFLRGLQGPFYLSSPEEQAEILAGMGVDCLITLEFTPALAALSAEEFMTLLKEHLGLCCLWVGQDFALGKNRTGNVAKLEEIGREMAFTLKAFPPFILDGEVVSSSLIRAQLQQGNVREAARLLSRPYRFSGAVVHGDNRGHSLGFPTANLLIPPDRMVPRSGVYATWATVAGRRYLAATNIGIRPTFENAPVSPRVEAHLLNFTGDIYGKQISLDFVEFIRPEQRFASIDELITQVQKDIQDTQEVLSNAP